MRQGVRAGETRAQPPRPCIAPSQTVGSVLPEARALKGRLESLSLGASLTVFSRGGETRSRRGGHPRLALGLFGRPVLGLPLLLQLAHALLERHEALDEGGHLVRHRVVHHARA